MLELSAAAATYVNEIKLNGGMEDHLLRVAPATAASADLRVAFVPSPQPGDQVGDSRGVALCVASELTDELDDKVLDVNDTGSSKGLVLRSV